MAATDASIALLAMTQSVAAFTTFLPPITEIRRQSVNDPAYRADVRVGEVAAASLTVGVGAMVSSLSGSNGPALVALTSALGLVILYEWTLRLDPNENVPEAGGHL